VKHLNAAKKYGAGISAAVGSALLLPVASVHAALPASVATGFTEMETDFESVFALAFPVLVTIVVAMIAWRYTRKFGNKL